MGIYIWKKKFIKLLIKNLTHEKVENKKWHINSQLLLQSFSTEEVSY